MQAPSIQDLVPIGKVWDGLAIVEERLLEASTSQDAFLTEVAQHLLRAGGKRFRPLLAQLASEFGPANDHRPAEAGVAVELIHVGSLYHDDVIDEADARRGAVSVNANWSNTVAILAGDFLMARASEVAATHLGQASVELLARTYAELVEGQTMELQLDHDLDHSPDAYYRVIGGKTASLIRTSARLGAMSSDATPDVVEALSTWAWELGLVFQITDDALDLVATDEFLGKPAGSDIREGKMTLPVLYAVDSPFGDEIRSLLSHAPYSEDAVMRVIQIVRDEGFVDRSLEEATQRIANAHAAISGLPEGEAKETLGRLGQFLIGQVDTARASR